ncbi:retrovirus-related pol polyprotein from transposon TNT 1-94 [Tanacetum coccineum]
MAQENYVEGCSTQRPHLLEPNGFFFRKARFETYFKSKDIDLWKVIQNGDFYFEVEDEETKLMKETSYELLKDEQKKQLDKNNEAKITLYNTLPFKNCKIDLLTQEYEKFSISNEETIDSGFTRSNAIVTSLKSLDPNYSRSELLKQESRKKVSSRSRAKVTYIEEAKYLATLPLKELIGNLKVYEMVLDNDGVGSKTTKEKVKSLALKDRVTKEQTNDDSDSQGGSDEDINEEETEAFNLLARNFRKGNRFGRRNRFGNNDNRFDKGRSNSFEDKGGKSSKKKEACYNCGIEGHFASECRKPKENKAFIGGAWSDSEDRDEHQNNATCLMAIDSQEENEELLKFNKDFAKTFEKLLNEKQSLEKENSKLSSKINDLQIEVKKLANDREIMDSSFTKHMIENRRLFTSNKAYDGGHVVFGSNLKGKVIGGGNITHDSITITNVEHVSGLTFNLISVGSQGNANNRIRKEVSTTRVLELLHLYLVGPSPIQSYRGNFYTSVDDHSNYTWVMFVESKEDVLEKFRILCKKLENLHDCYIVSTITNHSSKFGKLQFGSFCEQHGISYNLSGLFTSQSNKIVERTHRYSQTSKAYIVLNKEIMRIEESLNVTFDESLPERKSSSSVEYDRIDEPIVQDLNGSPSLQFSISDEGYPKSLKEARGHPIEQVIGELNERTLSSKTKQA